jgi:hypothetical protein
MPNPLEIIVNDISLDLFDGSADNWYITRQIHDLTNLQTRNASFSRNLEIPFTSKNASAFIGGTPTLITNPQAVIRQPCQIIVDGIPIILSGTSAIPGRTLSREGEVMQVLFEFENLEFFNNLIGNINNLIDWSDLDFDWTEANLSARANNTEDLVFAFSTWFNSENLTNNAPIYPIWTGQEVGETYGQEIDLLGFHIYLKEILKRIVETAGFTLDDSAMTDEQDYETLALACPMDAFYALSSNPDPYQALVSNLVGQTENAPANTSLTFTVEFDNIIVDGSPEIVFNDGLDRFDIVGVSFSSTTRFTISGTFTPQIGTDFLELRIVKNTTIINTVIVENSGIFVVQLTGTTDVDPGDFIYIEGFMQKNCSVTFNTGNEFSTVQGTEVIGRTIAVNEYIPSISKKSFIQSVLAYFNALLSTDNITKVVKITPLKDISTSPEIDLSGRIDTSREIELVHTLTNLYTLSTLKYADNDSLLRTDTNTVHIFQDDLIDERGTIIELLFGASDPQTSIVIPIYGGTIEYGNIRIDTETFSDTLKFKVSLAQAEQFSILNADDTNATLTFKRGDFLVLRYPPDGVYLRRIDEVLTENSGKVTVPFPVGFLGRETFSWNLIKVADQPLTPPRIANISRTTLSYQIYNGASESPEFTPVTGYFAEFANTMLFSNIKENFYKELLAALETPYLVRGWIRFEAAEFQSLSLLQPVYLQEFNSIFYINKIEQWNPSTKMCRIEFLRFGIYE